MFISYTIKADYASLKNRLAKILHTRHRKSTWVVGLGNLSDTRNNIRY